MLKKALILSMFLFVSCSYKVNEYGKRRYKTGALKTYSNPFLICDSSNVYNGYYKLVPLKTKKSSVLNHELRKNYLVFYSNGKVGKFLDSNEKDCDFNPKRAEMGYYGKVKEKYFMRFKEEYPDSYRILDIEIVYLDKDSLITYIKESSTSSGFFSKYVKVKSSIERSTDW